jgi:hypothetical protein
MRFTSWLSEEPYRPRGDEDLSQIPSDKGQTALHSRRVLQRALVPAKDGWLRGPKLPASDRRNWSDDGDLYPGDGNEDEV